MIKKIARVGREISVAGVMGALLVMVGYGVIQLHGFLFGISPVLGWAFDALGLFFLTGIIATAFYERERRVNKNRIMASLADMADKLLEQKEDGVMIIEFTREGEEMSINARME